MYIIKQNVTSIEIIWFNIKEQKNELSHERVINKL